MTNRRTSLSEIKSRAILGILLFLAFLIVICMNLTSNGQLDEPVQSKDNIEGYRLAEDGLDPTGDVTEEVALTGKENDNITTVDFSAVIKEVDLAACVNGNIHLLLLIFSKPENPRIRKAIRNSWGSGFYRTIEEPEEKYMTIFVVNILHSSHETELLEEAAENNDILLTQSHGEQLQTKMFASVLNWLGQIEPRCRPSFVLKSTDAIFHNMPILMKKLDPNSQPPYDVYRGKIVRNDKPNRNRKHPNHVPVVMYPRDKFPDLVQGPVYLFSYDVILRLISALRKVHQIAIEDVFVGLLAERAGILPHNDESFSLMKKTSNDCINIKLMFIFDVLPGDHVKLFNLVKREDTLHHCQQPQKDGL